LRVLIFIHRTFVVMTRVSIIILLALTAFAPLCNAQYAPQAPLSGHTGIPANSPSFNDWASGCTVYRGWQDIADKNLGHTTLGTESEVYGVPGSGILSLGDSGVAVVTFNYSIMNGEGPDFAVFENAFANPQNDTMAYLEFAFVEVSSDGVNFFRFPASSKEQATLQVDNFTYEDARKYNNLAGKYIAGYGTPFDLEELKNKPGLDVNHVTHVRIVDVVGSVDPLHASYDADENIINDPYPSPYPSGGFDLNGIGVIHSNKPATAIHETENALQIKVFPNPASEKINILYSGSSPLTFRLTDISGKEARSGTLNKNAVINIAGQQPGIYLLHLTDGTNKSVIKLVKQ
jgi:hypothetical protein